MIELVPNETELSHRVLALTSKCKDTCFVSERSVFLVLQAYDLMTTTVLIAIKAADAFQDKTTGICLLGPHLAASSDCRVVKRWYQTLETRAWKEVGFLPVDPKAFGDHDIHQHYRGNSSNVTPDVVCFGCETASIKQRLNDQTEKNRHTTCVSQTTCRPR